MQFFETEGNETRDELVRKLNRQFGKYSSDFLGKSWLSLLLTMSDLTVLEEEFENLEEDDKNPLGEGSDAEEDADPSVFRVSDFILKGFRAKKYTCEQKRAYVRYVFNLAIGVYPFLSEYKL